MASPLLLLPLALALAAPRQVEKIDLSSQFPDPPTRSQSKVGSCHTFAAVALVEAALRRAGKDLGGGPIRLSEADLFLQRTVLSDDFYKAFIKEDEHALKEGAMVHQDVEFLLDNGTALTPTWAKFLSQYTYFRAREREAMNKERLYWDVDRENPMSGEVLRRWWVEARRDTPEFRQLKDFLSGPPGQEEASAQAMKARLKEQRARVKAALAGFQGFHWAEGQQLPAITEPQLLSPADCAARGIVQLQAILAELRAGRPVAVSMELKGLKAWGAEASKEHAYHAFLVTGLDRPPGEDALFLVRNSWGGKNPVLREDELCRVYNITTVLEPGAAP